MQWLPLGVLLAAVAVTGRDLPGVLHFQIDPGTDNKQQLGFTPPDPNRGYIKDCSPNGTYFNFSWTPKELDPTKPVRFDCDVVSPIFFDKGKVVATLYFEDNPMISINKMVSCDDLIAAIPALAGFLKCPLKRGQRLVGSYVFPKTEQLIGYDGSYKASAQLSNEKGEQVLCLEIDVTVLPY